MKQKKHFNLDNLVFHLWKVLIVISIAIYLF